MSVGLFYNDLDWINGNIIKHLRSKGIKVEPININNFVLDIHSKNKFRHKLYINRVYPSSNYFSYNNLRFMLEITRHIENLGIQIINSFNSTYIDYSKTEANNILEKYNIPTARTLLLSNKETALGVANKLKFPKVIKMDSGGKARNIYKVNTKKEYLNAVSKLTKGNHLIHIEDFYKTKGFSTRLFILNYRVLNATKKTLISGWLGNPVRGSKTILYKDIPDKVIKLGEKVARITKSKILGLDIVETSKTPIVIDVNATPVFNACSKNYLGFDPAIKISDYIESVYIK